MKEYINIVSEVIQHGQPVDDRTGVGCYSNYGMKFHTNVSNSFPLMTHKKMSLRSIAAELVWFMSGSTDNAKLNELGATIWDEWDTKPDHDLGPIYGRQWRGFNNPDKTRSEQYPDQLAIALHTLVTNPTSRRIIVNSWNPLQVDDMALPPCHFSFQFHSAGDGVLSLTWYQRSADIMLGLPYNIASYALLLYIFAIATDSHPRLLTGLIGDAHIYHNHVDAADDVRRRQLHVPPRLRLDTEYFTPVEDLTTLSGCTAYLDRIFITQDKETVNQIVSALENYNHEDPLVLPVAV